MQRLSLLNIIILKSVNTVNDDTKFHFKTLYLRMFLKKKYNCGKCKLPTKMKSDSDTVTYFLGFYVVSAFRYELKLDEK